MCISVILPINRHIYLFLFYFSWRVIWKQLVKIMPFNNMKLNSVRLYGISKFKRNLSFVAKFIPLYGPL